MAHPEYGSTQLLFTTVPYGVIKDLPKCLEYVLQPDLANTRC